MDAQLAATGACPDDGMLRDVMLRRPDLAGRRLALALTQVLGDRLADLAELLDLLGAEWIEQVTANALDMAWRRRLEGGEPGVGQHGKLAAAVGLADLALHPASFLKAGNGVRQAAA